MALLDEIYARGEVVTAEGQVLKVHSGISREEGAFISNLILGDPRITRTLEVGCAYGLSSLSICAALRGRNGARHIIIDPFQQTQWQSVGVSNLRREGLGWFELVEERSEFALPRLTAERESQFDFIFIDGWHTFDHTMIDCFYATRLLGIGGYLVIDDAYFPAIAKVIRYLENYPCYQRVGSVKADAARDSLVALQKRTEDARPWNWYADF